MFRNKNGITLIALVLTIIVLLVLVGISVSLVTGDNGILSKSQNAKISTEIAEEKEIINYSVIQAIAGEEKRELLGDNFTVALEQNSKSDNKASIVGSDDEYFFIQFAKDGRYYEVDKNGKVSYLKDTTGSTKKLTVKCINSKNELLSIKEYTIIGNKYSKTSPQIEGYEAERDKLEGQITEDKTINAMYYYLCQDDVSIKFTGLDSNGNVPTNESDIKKYIVSGLNVNVSGLKYVLYIPDEYRGLPVTYIKRAGFEGTLIKKLVLGSNLKSIERCCFLSCTELEKLVIKSKTGIDFGEACFSGCRALSDMSIFSEKMTGSLNDAFGNCSSLKKIKINEDNEGLVSGEDGIVYSKDRTKLVFYPPAREGAFAFPDTVTAIGGGAFGGQLKLTDIEIPDTITSIGNFTFYGSKIKNVINRGNAITEGMYRSCSDLEKIVIGKNVTWIGRLAFYTDSKLKDITYEGTKEEWNKIWKSEWNTGISNITVKCSDGDIHYD